MKTLLTILLVAGFVGVAAFGIFDMPAGMSADMPGMQNHHDGCIAAIARGTDCPKESSLFEYLAFHLGAFKNLLTAIFSDGVAALSLLVLFFARIAFSASPGNEASLKFAYRWRDPLRTPSRYKIIRWLALHENSPTFS